MTTTLNEIIPVWRDLHAKASDLSRIPFDPNKPYEPLEKGEREIYNALTAALTQQAEKCFGRLPWDDSPMPAHAP